jgi:hypothetical protein
MNFIKVNLEKDFYIKVYEHTPDFEKPVSDEEHQRLQEKNDFIQGTYSYEIYKGKDEEPFFTDNHDVWSIDQAINLAYQDVPLYNILKEKNYE